MTAIATVVRAELVAGETPSCKICRHKRLNAFADQLYCTQLRSSARAGIIATHISAATPRGGRFVAIEKHCEELAHRCKFYQEEQ
jgi:hypothetical protein